MTGSIVELLGLAFIGSVAGLIGGVVLLFKKDWAKQLCGISVPLAVGVLLALSFLDLLPEAVGLIGDMAFWVVLLSFVVLFLIEHFVVYLHHHGSVERSSRMQGGVALVIVGDTIHNFLDGIAIGASFMIDPSLGLVVALAAFLHETPHEIADFGILLKAGWSRRRAFLANFVSALATFPGAIIAYVYFGGMETATGILLAITAGFFIYVATTDFLPEVEHSLGKSLPKQAFWLLVGIFVIALLTILVPEMG